MALRPGYLPPYPAPNQPNRQPATSPTLQSGPSGPISLSDLAPDNVNRPLVINLQTPQLLVATQPPVREVFNARTGGSPADGSAFAWWRANPLAIYIVNGQDVDTLVEIHGNMGPDTSSRLPIPLRSIQVGAGLRRLITLNPNAQDQWSPYVWPVVSGVGTALAGNVVVQMSTPV